MIQLVKMKDPMGAASLLFDHGQHNRFGDECLQYLCLLPVSAWPGKVVPHAASELLLRCCLRHADTAAKIGWSTVSATEDVNKASALVRSEWTGLSHNTDHVSRVKMLLAQARMQLLCRNDGSSDSASNHSSSQVWFM